MKIRRRGETWEEEPVKTEDRRRGLGKTKFWRIKEEDKKKKKREEEEISFTRQIKI